MKIFQNKKLTSNATDIDATKIPKHIAFICDGNGRWAQSRGLPRYEGHKAGVESIKKVVSRCQELGVEVVSFYCFSTENFSRPKAEVEYLFKLFKKIEKYEDDPNFKDAKIVVMGDLSLFPDELQNCFVELRKEQGTIQKSLLIWVLDMAAGVKLHLLLTK